MRFDVAMSERRAGMVVEADRTSMRYHELTDLIPERGKPDMMVSANETE